MKPQVLTHLFKALEEADRENASVKRIDTKRIKFAIESVIADRHGKPFVREILRRLGDWTNATDYEVSKIASDVIAGR